MSDRVEKLPEAREWMPGVLCWVCGLDISGTDDGTGIPYCDNCGEGKDDEHLVGEER